MVKNKKTTEQLMLDIASGKSQPLVCSRKAPTLYSSVGNNNNKGNNNYNTKKKKTPIAAKSTSNVIINNTKKKKTPTATKSTLNAINRADDSRKLNKRSRAQQRLPHTSDDDDNDDDYHQPNLSIVIAPDPIAVPPNPVPAFQPVSSIPVPVF